MKRMNPEFKDKLLIALRSGDYRQTRSQLKNTDGCYCVMGVGCQLSGLGDWVDDGDDGYMCYVLKDGVGYWSGAPQPVLDQMGIDSETENWLGYMNDEQKKTFVEIAAFIEENL